MSHFRQNATDRSSRRDDIGAEVVRLLASNLGTWLELDAEPEALIP